jgi:hypothetical protein
MVQNQAGQIVHETLSQKYPIERGGTVAQVVECLPIKHKPRGETPIPLKAKQKKPTKTKQKKKTRNGSLMEYFSFLCPIYDLYMGKIFII